MKTVGDALDAGVTWDQFADAEWDGAPSFASAEEAEAHRGDPLRSDPTVDTDGRFAEYAREHLEAALNGLANNGSYEEVVSEAEAALMALHVLYGNTEPFTLVPADVLEDIGRSEPTCVCPPDLVARGGYRGGCPAHNPT
jgi:hypothetical protein